MSVKRVVSTEFWTDEKVSVEFTPGEKLFFLYLLTNPHTTQLGIYKILPRQIAFEVGCTEEEALFMLDKFENEYGIIKYSMNTKEVAIRKYLNYSIVKGGRPVFDLLVKEALNVKDITLFDYIKTGACSSHNETVKAFIEYITNNSISSIHNENDNDNEESYIESSKKNGWGEYFNVYLTDAEFEAIITQNGEEFGLYAINWFGMYLREKKYVSSSHYDALQRWAIAEARKRYESDLLTGGNEQPPAKFYA